MEYNKSERLLKKIDKAYNEYGKNRIILTGTNLNDIFLRDLKEGSYSILESLKRYGKENKKFKWFIYFNESEKAVFYELNDDKYEEKRFEDYIKVKLNGMASKMISSNMNERRENTVPEEEEKKDIDSKVESVKPADKRLVRIMLELQKEGKEEREDTLVYIENFDWKAKFYDSEQDGELINNLKKLEKLKKHLVIIASKQIDTLTEKYYEKYDDKEVIEIGTPNKIEIEIALQRIAMFTQGKTLKKINMSQLSEELSNSNYSLRECCKLFKKKLIAFGDDLKIENFEFKKKIEEKVFWKDVVLNNKKKEEISQIIKTFKSGKENFQKGLLLTGPPGTGKTYIAKALANEEKLYFMCPKLSELKGQYVGQSAPKVKALFEEARLNEPTLIFLDEIDTLFPLRDGAEGDSYTKDIVNEFLQQLDGVDTGSQKIFVLSASNRIESIDQAVRSRLGNPMEIGLPDEDDRIEIIKRSPVKILRENEFWSKLKSDYLKELKRRTSGMSGRDIKYFTSKLESGIGKLNDIELQQLQADDIYKKYFREEFNERKNILIGDLERTTGLNCLRVSEIKDINLYGIEKTKTKLNKKIFNQLKNVKIREDNKLEMLNGILLYGPPGNGKTELVEYLGKENNCIVIKVESKNTIGYTSNDTLKNIDKIFTKAIQLSKVCDRDEGVILFFDEFDSLVGGNLSSEVRGTVLGKIADKCGIRAQDSKVILVAATNFYNAIDEAVKRRGRFDIAEELGNPTKEDAPIIVKEFFNAEKISFSEDSIVGKFYEEVRLVQYEKEIKILESIGKFVDEEELTKTKEKRKKDLTISSAHIKNAVIDLRRHLILEGRDKNELELNEEILKEFIALL